MSHNAETKLKGGTLWSRQVLYGTRKPFWFSCLGKRVQSGVFSKLCRTFGVELFWSLQVYRKKIEKKTFKNTEEKP